MYQILRDVFKLLFIGKHIALNVYMYQKIKRLEIGDPKFNLRNYKKILGGKTKEKEYI